MIAFNVNEIFGPTIQGEGIDTGTPSIFLRTNGCNLRCSFADSICDSPYSSFAPDTTIARTPEEALGVVGKLFNKYPYVPDLVITGGEPFLQGVGLEHFIGLFRNLFPHKCITIETNGTLCTVSEPVLSQIHLVSISPKLSNSATPKPDIPERVTAAHNRNRINHGACACLINHCQNFQVKFVWSHNSDEAEIQQYLHDLADVSQAPLTRLNQHVLIMPEGATNEQMSTSSQSAIDCCIRNGWRYTDRLQIRIWGDKRGV